MAERPKAYVEKDMEEIIPDFFDESRNEVQNLKEALENGDYGELKDLGHKIKGSSVTFSEGFQEMSDIGKALDITDHGARNLMQRAKLQLRHCVEEKLRRNQNE